MLVDRRTFLRIAGASLWALRLDARDRSAKSEIAMTMDDPRLDLVPSIPGIDLNRRILGLLAKQRVKAALFVCGMRIDNPGGPALLREWDAAGHLICSHSYSHLLYNSADISFERFSADFLKNEPLIRDYNHFTRLFRYPFLKEGESAEKRDRFRALLREKGYGVGHVTVDASDWYIDRRMRLRLESDPKANTAPYRDYYIAHIRDRASYYRQLSRSVLGRDVRHTLLLHHNPLNALYLGDMMQALQEDGWRWIDAAHAFRDPVFKREPRTIPAGESLVWALAKESGRFDSTLRYPGEDGDYEKPKMDALGL